MTLFFLQLELIKQKGPPENEIGRFLIRARAWPQPVSHAAYDLSSLQKLVGEGADFIDGLLGERTQKETEITPAQYMKKEPSGPLPTVRF